MSDSYFVAAIGFAAGWTVGWVGVSFLLKRLEERRNK